MRRLPNFDMTFFLDEHDDLKSHAQQMGKVVEETYKEGGQSIREFKGIKTTVTYHWEVRWAARALERESRARARGRST